jgi:uncharacterized protein YmfQ (DUF2313 family)
MAPRDRHIRRGQKEYSVALAALLPQGLAWPRWPSSLLMKLVTGLAGIFGFVDDRAADLLETESDPRKTVEILPEWERAFGLPDHCLPIPTDIDTRHKVLVRRITMLGAQSRAFFIALAASIGYQITIREFSPFQVGVSRVGNTRNLDDGVHYRWNIGHSDMRFYWVIRVNPIFLLWFHVGDGGLYIPQQTWQTRLSMCGIDPLLTIGRRTDLECILRRYGPAHTMLLFDYSQTPTRIPVRKLTLTTTPPSLFQLNIGGSDLEEDGTSFGLREDGTRELRE